MASHRRTPQRTGRALLLSTAAVAVTTAAVPSAVAEPGDATQGLATRVDRLYRQAEIAVDRYDAARERADRLRAGLDELRDRAARGQQSVNRLRDALGAVAGAQYRSGGVDPAVALMLSSGPDHYLDRAAALDRISSRQAARLRQLRAAQRALAQTRGEAYGRLTELGEVRDELRARRQAVRQRLAAARRLLDSFSRQRRAGPVSWFGESASGADGGLGLAPPGGHPASLRAAAALTAARTAVGRPYVWGSAGPLGFDCSGLMVWAYRQAGVALPRTSQAQARAGHRVPLTLARPGDLVIYRGDASHVAMYVGGGRVVHAPYPGALVRYDPVDMLPVSAVTRPA